MATLPNQTMVSRAQPLALGQQARTSDNYVYLAVLLGYLLLIPTPANLEIAGSVLPPYRLVLIPSALLVLTSAVRARFRLLLPDILVLIATLWISVAMFVNTGGTQAVTAVVSNTVDIALSYFFARVVFQNPRDFRIFLILMAPGIFLVGAIIMLESITFRPFVHETFTNIFGGSHRRRLVERLALMRAFGPFPHPILAGIFLVSFLPLYLLSGIRGWPRILGASAALFSFFTLSSAALLGLVVSAIMLAYNWLTERVANLTWRMFLIALTMVGLALEFLTQNGAFSFLTRYASLNTVTARHRLLIWKHGTANVESHPWFGIGYADWERPAWMLDSVDHYWLLLAMQFGVIVPFLIALTIALAVLNASRASVLGPQADRMMLRGIAISLGVFAFGVISVSIWLSVQTWFYMLAGVAVTLSARALEFAKSAERAKARKAFHAAATQEPKLLT